MRGPKAAWLGWWSRPLGLSPGRRGLALPAPRLALKADPTLEEDVCLVPPSEEDVLRFKEALFAETAAYDGVLSLVPLVSPVLGFWTYGEFAKATRCALDSFRQSWMSVDGNQYEISILTPTINGVVMPAVSIAVGTLAATTVSTLRQRQLDLRERLNRELGEIELLRSTIYALLDDGLDRGTAAWATLLLRDYTGRLVVECHPDAGANIGDTELNALYRLFVKLCDAPAAASALGLVQSLVALRAARLTLLASTTPPSQFLVLACGSVSIVIAFLIESDQEVLRFLDAVQLRILFGILVGVFSGLAAVLVDLADVFRGSLRITPVAAQLLALRELLTFDLCCQDQQPTMQSTMPPTMPVAQEASHLRRDTVDVGWPARVPSSTPY